MGAGLSVFDFMRPFLRVSQPHMLRVRARTVVSRETGVEGWEDSAVRDDEVVRHFSDAEEVDLDFRRHEAGNEFGTGPRSIRCTAGSDGEGGE